ncbi:MAG: hydroxymethylglutaryl-CoA synthase family protein [Candidatus Altiarchaeota archaeon]|nr:hydroxymethylglutaryl-CoA synthase family protein [Candidatus Altiarchaeota archaeon]
MGGIDDIYIYLPNYYLDIDEGTKVFEKKKQPHVSMTAEKFKGLVSKGLGVTKISVAYGEDVTSMTLNAFEKLSEAVDFSDVTRVIVSSETPDDLSKPKSSKIPGRFGVGNNVIAYDTYFACLAGVASLVDSVKIYDLSGEKTAGAAGDISEYSLNSDNTSISADLTGGAGVAAFKVGEGDLLGVGESGVYTSDQYDFSKPKVSTSTSGTLGEPGFVETVNFTQFPVVFGGFSELIYFKHVGEAYRNLKSKINSNLSDFKLVAFHIPYPGITKHAFRYLQAIDNGTDGEITDILDSLTPLDSFETSLDLETYLSSEVEIKRKHTKSRLKEMFSTKTDQDLYASLVGPTLTYSAEVGNLYTGSTFLSIASGLVHGDYSADDKILTIGYGSGSSAIATEMTITEKTRDIANGWDLGKRMESRQQLTAEEYLDYRDNNISNSTMLDQWSLNCALDQGIPIYAKI